MTWSATQYLKFEDERTRPARDLLAQVPLDRVRKVYDLGCGPGNSTELLVDRFGPIGVEGIDADQNMLETARQRLPAVNFSMADLATWKPKIRADLLYANAVFQWLPDHLPLLTRLTESLVPGGVLAIQMPDNLDQPSHVAMRETAADGPWAPTFADGAVRARLPSPRDYLEALGPVSTHVDVWHTHYYHPLANAEAIVEWVKGTGLRPYLARAGADHAEAFTQAYTKRVADAYPPMADGRVLLKFPRLFVVAVKR